MAKSNEESLFQTAIVPLKLVVEGTEVWTNKRPNSSHFCRPLHLQYRKESKELAVEEQQDILEQLDRDRIIMLYIKREGTDEVVKLTVNIKLDLTMFDGKIVNFLTDTANCNICGAKPSEMNDLVKIGAKPINDDAGGLGLSTLHCWIRSFEYVLHLGYKRDR